MRKTHFLFLIFTLFSICSFAQQKKEEKKSPRILILLDESSSMANEWEIGKSRIKTAGEIILRLMDSIYKVNKNVEFALRAFGQQYPVQENNCYDTRLEVRFSKDNYTQMMLRLSDLHPRGVTPIAYTLSEAAANDLVGEWEYGYSIVLITDGGESCGGNICDVVQKLLNSKIYFKPYIVSLVDYAPLHTEYDCLGSFLQVTRSKDIGNAIDTIVESFRPALTMKPAEYRRYILTQMPTPSVLQIKTPDIKITRDTVEVKKVIAPPPVITRNAPHLNPIAADHTMVAPKVPPILAHHLNNALQPIGKVVISKPPVEQRAKELALQQIDRKRELTPLFIPTKILVADRGVKPGKVVISNPAPELRNEKPIQAIRSDKDIRHFGYVFGYFPSYNKVKIQPVQAVKQVALPTRPSNPPPPPIAPIKAAAVKKEDKNKIDYKTVADLSDHTSVEVYLTNGTGKYYKTTPQIVFLDAKTGKKVKEFTRSVDAYGNPLPITDIAAGKYIVALKSKRGDYTSDVLQVVFNAKNKIEIIAPSGSLHFYYIDAPNRPVSEFDALVTHRERGGKETNQNCSKILPYETGNYHIEVNTIPKTSSYVDLDIGDETDIPIYQPGYLQITNTTPQGNVKIWYQVNDGFVRLKGIDVPGDLSRQIYRLQPNYIYELRYLANPNISSALEKNIPFRIKSNDTTRLQIK